MLCALKNFQFGFQEKNPTLNQDSDLQITSLALLPIELFKFHSNSCSNVPLETVNAKCFPLSYM